MSSLTAPTLDQGLRRAAVRATLAPSVHNTQPWRFVLGPDWLEIHADPTRRLLVLDPAARQLIISCGCALFNARVSLAAAGHRTRVVRFPDPAQADLLARVTVGGEPGAAELDAEDSELAGIAALEPMIEARHSNRRRFDDAVVPEDIVDELIAAAAVEGALLVPVTRPEDRLSVAMANQRADAQENPDPAYRAELRTWTSDDPGRDDGVLAEAVPHGGGGAHDDVPIRDFDTHGAGALPTQTRSSLKQCMLLLGTAVDSPVAWLRAGEAMERTLLEVARRGYATSPLTQLIEMPNTRATLRQDLRLTMHPHVLLRVGRETATADTRRRRLVDMLVTSA